MLRKGTLWLYCEELASSWRMRVQVYQCSAKGLWDSRSFTVVGGCPVWQCPPSLLHVFSLPCQGALLWGSVQGQCLMSSNMRLLGQK